MHITAEISLFPIIENKKGLLIKKFLESIQKKNLTIDYSPFSTFIEGEPSIVFECIEEAYQNLCLEYTEIELLLDIRIINRKKLFGGN